MGLLWHASSSPSAPGPVGSSPLSSLSLSLRAVWHWDRGPHGHRGHRLKRFFREAAGCCGQWQAGLWRGEAGQRVQVWTGKEAGMKQSGLQEEEKQAG